MEEKNSDDRSPPVFLLAMVDSSKKLLRYEKSADELETWIHYANYFAIHFPNEPFISKKKKILNPSLRNKMTCNQEQKCKFLLSNNISPISAE